MQNERVYKNVWFQIGLCLVFGPLGLLYSNVVVSLLLSIVFIPLIFAFGFGLILGWPFSVIVGVYSVRAHNKKLDDFAGLLERQERLKRSQMKPGL